MKPKIYPVLMAIVMVCVSCNHKDLCYMEMQKSKIIVEYDWSEAPEATSAGMCVFLYSVSDPNAYYRFDFDNTKGGEIEIPAGRYVLITYNNDTELVRFSGTNVFGNHVAYTREGDLLEPLYGNGVTSAVKPTNGERVCITPDGLWGCHAYDVAISEHGVTYTIDRYNDSRDGSDEDIHSSGDQTITLYPHDMLCHYSYEVKHVENAQNISSISASISGMSVSLGMSDESLGSENITLPVSGTVDPSASKVTGEFLAFGHNGNGTVSHKMAFFVIMKNGAKYRIEGDDSFDVSSQVDNAPDQRHVHIVIDRLSVPEQDSEEEGWDPTVDDWGVQEEDLQV